MHAPAWDRGVTTTWGRIPSWCPVWLWGISRRGTIRSRLTRVTGNRWSGISSTWLMTWGHHLDRGCLHRPTLLVSLFKLYFVLSLNAGAYTAPKDVCYAVKQLRSVSNLIVPTEASGNAADACKVLRAYHAANDAIVAFRVLQSEFVLNHPSGRGDRLGEATEHLEAQAKLRATLLAETARAWAIAIATHVSGHVTIKCLLA